MIVVLSLLVEGGCCRKAEILSVGPSHPEIIGRPAKFALCIFVSV